VQRRIPIGDGETDAVAAPILASGAPAGAIVAFAAPVRAGLVRATGEVADWVAAQVELGELDASRAALAEAEVRALRAQISPHFIYNSLNAIASFINTDPAKARELVLEFADFTRYSFRRHGDFTTVAEELRSIDSYLKLERARFGDRLTVTLQVAPEVLSTVIPFLSMQPLVENAVRHGIDPSEDGGSIEIRIERRDNRCVVRVSDTGLGLRHSGGGLGTGLATLRERLQLVFGNAATLSVAEQRPRGVRAELDIPAQELQA
jgi:two-component system LytT family sensor kinase